MARLSKRERRAKAAWVVARAHKVRRNLGNVSEASKLAGVTFMSGSGRERSLLGCLQGTRHEDRKALKQHSLTRGCSAPGSGHGPGTGYDRLRQATISGLIRGAKSGKAPRAKPKGLWSEPVPQDELSKAILDGQSQCHDRHLYETDLVSVARSAKIATETAETAAKDTPTPTGWQGRPKRGRAKTDTPTVNRVFRRIV